ncbi:MAG: esterase-like activity of phytase family protein [Gammaproteobacteria bacterium]
MKKTCLPFLLLPLFGAPAAQAAVALIAVGQIDANYRDLSTRTAGPLENGVPGNILGGIGSGLAYAGGNTFLALPDRGPNATPYKPALDDTVSYINRFQTLSLTLAPNPDYNAAVIGSMPYLLSPFLTATTLLSSKALLSYGVGGTPALNTAERHYFSGRSDNFNPDKRSTNPYHGRFDPEGIRVSNDGKSVFISDEYGPYVYQFNRATGKRVKAFKLPDYYAVKHLSAMGDSEIADNNVGRTANKGMEGLAITPNGKTLVGIMQTQLLQDEKKFVRIVTIDIETGATHEYAYLLTDGSGVSEIVAINNHEFLVDERDGKGLGDGSEAVVKKLYKIDLAGAVDISGSAKIGSGTPTVAKTLFLDIVAELTANGIDAEHIPAKIEGIAFGPNMVIGGAKKHTLFVANDNDFLPSVDGIDNPNQFFVFSIDEADLPTFRRQIIAPLPVDRHNRG